MPVIRTAAHKALQEHAKEERARDVDREDRHRDAVYCREREAECLAGAGTDGAADVEPTLGTTLGEEVLFVARSSWVAPPANPRTLIGRICR